MGAAFANHTSPDGGFATSDAGTLKQFVACGHVHHVGTCPCCQRAQLARWRDQLASVTSERRAA
jgi:hypothetical protein